MPHKTTIRDDTSARHLRKYTNRNPVHRLTLGRFFDALAEEMRLLNPENVLEFGCGEGLLLEQLKKRGIRFQSYTGIDLRDDALEHARSLHPEHLFLKADLLQWEHPAKSFDLVIASQVLEHLYNPEVFMERLMHYCGRDILLTVPLEPWFRIMNLLRGRDILRLGNHPEHINHWGLNEFRALVSRFASVEKAYSVFPFIIIHARSLST
ncbi:MAG: class I SAM-dependent methyltransferase [Nitrospirae bacterium]|nr:class I SAM-dependent methyltransferase [Nitrospirota bacterium]